MMSGKFREYNWRDIVRLIFADAGLKTDDEQRIRGEMSYARIFNPPESETETCVRVAVYDKDFSDRIKDHAGRNP